jgi:hypothetical protein
MWYVAGPRVSARSQACACNVRARRYFAFSVVSVIIVLSVVSLGVDAAHSPNAISKRKLQRQAERFCVTACWNASP